MSAHKCAECGKEIATARHGLGYHVCLVCGERNALMIKRTVAPMHKSNYMLITNLEDLKGLNNKGGNIR
jgi:ribosomal protein L37AE/L43A